MIDRIMVKPLRSVSSAFVLACSLLPGLAAASLGDVPVWNLWENTSGNLAGGDGATVTLCGNVGCNSKDMATFEVWTTQPAGSGYIDPFLRFQHNETGGVAGGPNQTYCEGGITSCGSASGGVEAAYNTNNDKLQADGSFINQAKDTTAGSGNPAEDFNHAVRIADLLEVGGNFQFLLDINEPGEGNLEARTILLDELEFFISTRDDLNFYQPESVAGSLGTLGFKDASGNHKPEFEAEKIWDMDAAVTQQEPCSNGNGGNKPCGGIRLDSAQGSAGSGDFDMRVLLSANLFKNADGSRKDGYVYLYNYFGDVNKRSYDDASAGFEEWSVLTSNDSTVPPSSTVAEPATLTMLGLGLAGFVRLRRRRAVV